MTFLHYFRIAYDDLFCCGHGLRRMRYYDTLTVYLYWLFFGWFGLHHFYLRRDRHAFVWFWTCGGFVFGWLFELWRIPDYVRTANVELDQTESVPQWSVVRVPSVRIKRVIGEFVFSFYLSYLATSALPDEILNDFLWTSTISAFAVAVGKIISSTYIVYSVYKSMLLCFSFPYF